MKHIGNITEVDGGEIDPVDIITFGSPCQDLSVAGSRKGLAGERSGLFLEAVRVIIEDFEKITLPWWEGEVIGRMVGGKPRGFMVYLEGKAP